MDMGLLEYADAPSFTPEQRHSAQRILVARGRYEGDALVATQPRVLSLVSNFEAVNGASLKLLSVVTYTHVRPEGGMPPSLKSLENDHGAVKSSISGKSDIHMLLSVMDIQEGAPGRNPPAGFRALYDTFSRVVSGEQKSALNPVLLGASSPGTMRLNVSPPYAACSAGFSAETPRPFPS
jgi:hypothetical protein